MDVQDSQDLRDKRDSRDKQDFFVRIVDVVVEVGRGCIASRVR